MWHKVTIDRGVEIIRRHNDQLSIVSVAQACSLGNTCPRIIERFLSLP